jgi:AraC-like DNA-binding protein
MGKTTQHGRHLIMEKGDVAKIAEFAGLNQSTIYRYFKGKSVRFRTHLKIQNAIRRLHIKTYNFTFPKYDKTPIDRWDIYHNLPYGAEKRIGRKLGIDRYKVWRILHGKILDDYGVIKESELEAAINIWKTRFCKFKSQL